MICKAHFVRTGRKVLATRIVGDEWMCQSCFKGRPINDVEEHGELRGNKFRKIFRRHWVRVLNGNTQAHAKNTVGKIVGSRQLV